MQILPLKLSNEPFSIALHFLYYYSFMLLVPFFLSLSLYSYVPFYIECQLKLLEIIWLVKESFIKIYANIHLIMSRARECFFCLLVVCLFICFLASLTHETIFYSHSQMFCHQWTVVCMWTLCDHADKIDLRYVCMKNLWN